MSKNMVRVQSIEEGWPCQRLRLAFGLILFFFFETLIGKKLPEFMPMLCLGIGIASFVSAMNQIRTWQMKARIFLIQEAIDQARL